MDKRASQPVTASADGSREIVGLVSEISPTKSGVPSTVNANEQRLSPAHLKEQIAELKDSALGQYHQATAHVKDDLAR